MATVYGVNATKRDVNVPSDKINPGEVESPLKVAYDEYTASGAIALNDEIILMEVPEGARVHELIMESDDLGTTGVLDVGWKASDDGDESEDQNGFLSAVNVNTAAAVNRMSDSAGLAGHMKEFSGRCKVFAKATTATDAAGTIKVTLLYSLR